MTDATLPADLAGSVVGRGLTWFLDRLRDGGSALTDEDVAAPVRDHFGDGATVGYG